MYVYTYGFNCYKVLKIRYIYIKTLVYVSVLSSILLYNQ